MHLVTALTTASAVDNGSSDACGIESLALDNTDFTCANVGSGNIVVLTVTDVNGNAKYLYFDSHSTRQCDHQQHFVRM